MLKTASFLFAGLVIGFVVAAWWGGDSGAPSSSTFDGTAPVAQRIDALESAVSDERFRRLELERQIDALEQRISELPSVHEGGAIASVDAPPRGAAESSELPVDDVAPPLREELRFGPRARLGRDDAETVERFVAAGIAPDRAQWIVQRTAELRMEALQAQYDVARGAAEPDQLANLNRANALRDELGDADYERYLQALNRPTSVGVRDVLASSPAAQAGLQPGDQVTAYGGKRVFDMSDLNRLVLEGEPGQMVAIDVLRDGQPVQLYVPRGPIGITGGGFARGPGRR